MMPGRLYFKIFISFIGVILIAMLLVAMLFRHTEGEKFIGGINRMAQAQVTMMRTLVEEQAISHPGSHDRLQEVVVQLAEIYDAKIWITNPEGFVIASSFPGPPPSVQGLEPFQPRMGHGGPPPPPEMHGVTLSKCEDDERCMYATIPFGDRPGIPPGIIHTYLKDPISRQHERGFLLGLIGIAMAVALLIIPVSWIITRRLNRLRMTALRIADGDLSYRADMCGRDEVAKVGWALNTMADSLSRMIRGGKELTANVSHELRTPLTRIRIAEEMLRQRMGDADASLLDSIREDVDSLDHLIGRMLALSKLDLREMPFHMEEVDVAEMLDAIVTHLGPIADHNRIKMSLEQPDHAVIQADGESLFHALRNILENGVKHGEPNGTMTATLSRDETELTIVTENTHPPLPDMDLKGIFEPFNRAKGTKPQGTGLGLAIAKRVVEGHNGSIRAENGDGCVRFVVKLPVRQEGL